MQNKPTHLLAARITATLLISGLAVGVYQDLSARYGSMVASGNLPATLIAYSLFALAAAILGLVQLWRPGWLGWMGHFRTAPAWLRWPATFIVGIIPSWFFLYTRYSEVFSGTFVRLLVLIIALAVMAWLASGSKTRPYTWQGVLAAIILFGGTFTLLNTFRSVVSYPLGLGWSEGNRMWDYSVMFGSRLYDFDGDHGIYAYIDRGRQGLWGLPWLFGDIGIKGFRAWNAILFTVPYFLLGLAVLSPRKERPVTWLLFGLWSMLFLNQGPIYTPLVLAAILVAIARRSPLWLSFILTAVAGYFAQLTRETWLFAPAMWAVLIYMLENPPLAVSTLSDGQKSSWFKRTAYRLKLMETPRAWLPAALIGFAGLLGGYLYPDLIQDWWRKLQTGVSASSALSIENLSGKFSRQPLLWDRLWPNATYAPGIVWGLVMAAGAVVILLVYLVVSRRWRLNAWQKACLGAVLLAFLAVGVVVSVKIGGGSNLHNLDMFLIACLFAAGLAWEAGGRGLFETPSKYPLVVNMLFFIALLYPASQGMLNALPLETPSQFKAQEAIHAVQVAVDRYQPQGEVLFIDQRQLLTFGEVTGVKLVDQYEKKHMMDQAMADNANYFAGFFRDLADRRFSLIISEPLWVKYQGGTYHFGDENDSWVKWVSAPVLCYYEPLETFQEVGLQLLVPRAETTVPEGADACPFN